MIENERSLQYPIHQVLGGGLHGHVMPKGSYRKRPDEAPINKTEPIKRPDQAIIQIDNWGTLEEVPNWGSMNHISG